MKAAPFDVPRPPRWEKAVLVGHAGRDKEHLDRSMEEEYLLADTANAKVLGSLVQRRGSLHPATFIGKGKIDELKALLESTGAEMVIFDDDLSPAQVRNLEKATNAARSSTARS